MMVRDGTERRIFLAILIAAAVVRLMAFNAFSAHHPDELIQYLEQAHRLVFGYGLVPWEFRLSIRSWLIPLLLAPPMQVGHWLDPTGELYLVLPRLMVVAINFAAVPAAWALGRRLSVQHAAIAMLVMAFWFESIAFSVQTLTESMAVSLFLVAAALLRADARFRNVVWAGVLIALAGLMRFQFGPAMALFAAMVAGKDRRLWSGMFAGGIPVVVAGGAIDLAHGLLPYQWILNNYLQNIAGGKMQYIAGHGDPRAYFLFLARQWQLAVIPIALLTWVGARRYPALATCALVNFLFHQLIDHKEYRYIWLTVDIAILLAALGSVDVVRSAWMSRWSQRLGNINMAALVSAGWLLVSATLGAAMVHRRDFRIENDPGRLAALAMRSPAVCGLAVPRLQYWQFGYALLHRDKPLLLLGSKGEFTRSAPGLAGDGANALIAYPSDIPPPPPWRPIGCTGDGKERSCLYLRPGGCQRTAVTRDYEAQQVLNRVGM